MKSKQGEMPVPKTLLSSVGYGIRKDMIDEKELRNIRKKLTVRPFVPPSSPVQPPAFPVYAESPQRIWVPREWGRDNYGEPQLCKIDPGIDCKKNLEFKGKLREYQLDILNKWVDVVLPSKRPEGRILTVPCGYGKTVMSLWCASEVGRKTMIVVHKEFLMNQFKKEISHFLPKASIGKIQGDTVDVEGRDIVLVMLQSIVLRKYPPSTFKGFGMVIFDECHHLSAEVFSRALLFLGFYRILGLSATPVRKDNLSKVFHWHMGGFLANIESRRTESVKVWKLPHLVNKKNEGEKTYLEEPLTATGYVCLPNLITRVATRDDRSAMIAEIVATLVIKEKRCVLILADRKGFLSWLFNYITSDKFYKGSFKDDVGYYIGGMKESELENSATKNIILGTFAMASEGMNIPRLDTLVLGTSKSDVVQSVGRILRKKPEDRHVVPLVVDIVDPHPALKKQFQKRRQMYNKYKYDIENVKWDASRRTVVPFKTTETVETNTRCLILD
jgi:hypothetical protein